MRTDEKRMTLDLKREWWWEKKKKKKRGGKEKDELMERRRRSWNLPAFEPFEPRNQG